MTAFKFDPNALEPTSTLLVPKNVFERIFLDENAKAETLKSWMIRHPDRVRLTEAAVFFDKGKAVFKTEDAKNFEGY